MMRDLIHASNMITSWLLDNTDESFDEVPEVDRIHTLLEDYIQQEEQDHDEVHN